MKVILQCPDACPHFAIGSDEWTPHGDQITMFEENPNRIYDATEKSEYSGRPYRIFDIREIKSTYFPESWLIFLEPLPPQEGIDDLF